jgi:hypothetical protein
MAAKKPAPQHLISTPPRRSQCRRCGAYVLWCYVKGTGRRLDPTPVTLHGEAVALLAGAHTYMVAILGRHGPVLRSAAMITRGLPEYGRIHAGHLCGLDLSHYPDGRVWFADASPEICPF